MTTAHVRGTLQFLQSENQRLQDEVQILRQENIQLRLTLRALRTLQKSSMNISVHTDIIKLLERMLQASLMSIDASDGSLMLVDDETNELAFAVVHGQVRDSLVGYRIPMGTGIAGWVAENKEPVVIPDVHRDPRFSTTVDRTFRFKTRSMICVPIIFGDRILGVFQALNKFEGHPFDEADLMTMSIAAQLASTAIMKAEEAVSADD